MQGAPHWTSPLCTPVKSTRRRAMLQTPSDREFFDHLAVICQRRRPQHVQGVYPVSRFPVLVSTCIQQGNCCSEWNPHIVHLPSRRWMLCTVFSMGCSLLEPFDLSHLTVRLPPLYRLGCGWSAALPSSLVHACTAQIQSASWRLIVSRPHIPPAPFPFILLSQRNRVRRTTVDQTPSQLLRNWIP